MMMPSGPHGIMKKIKMTDKEFEEKFKVIMATWSNTRLVKKFRIATLAKRLLDLCTEYLAGS